VFSYSDAVMPVTCETHGGRAIEYYCETDQVPNCSQCALLGDHQGHKITTCDEKASKLNSPFHCSVYFLYAHQFHCLFKVLFLNC